MDTNLARFYRHPLDTDLELANPECRVVIGFPFKTDQNHTEFFFYNGKDWYKLVSWFTHQTPKCEVIEDNTLVVILDTFVEQNPPKHETPRSMRTDYTMFTATASFEQLGLALSNWGVKSAKAGEVLIKQAARIAQEYASRTP
jgi:hypothetical protein